MLRCFMRMLAVAALVLTVLPRPVPAAEGMQPLSRVAPQLGYGYAWIASQSAVALTRPGVYVLVRAGNQLYDVNESIESTSVAPAYHDNDIYVGASLVTQLRAIAAKYPLGRAVAALAAGPAVSEVPEVRGSLALSVMPSNGAESIDVTGTGPASVPVDIALYADVSRDVPRIVISRTRLRTDASGKFAARISLAPLHLQKSLVRIVATSLSGIAPADASLVLGQPNPAVANPVDQTPRDFRRP